MCVYNGRRVTRAAYIRLKQLEKPLHHAMNTPLGNGFEYGNWPIVRPAADGNLHISMAHWEFIPDWVQTKEELPGFRKNYITLNAKGESLLQSPMYADAARQRRCLILSSHFFEYRQVGREKIPYRIGLKNQEYFYMAGIWQQWTDRQTQKTGTTFSMITTAANPLMEQIHNTKRRMPTILPELLAYEWLYKPLSPAAITELATYQLPAGDMEAWPVSRDFRTSPNPEEKAVYAGLAELV